MTSKDLTHDEMQRLFRALEEVRRYLERVRDHLGKRGFSKKHAIYRSLEQSIVAIEQTKMAVFKASAELARAEAPGWGLLQRAKDSRDERN